MRKTELLDKYARDGDSRLLLARVLDQWQRAEQRGVPTHTGFLSPGGAGGERGACSWPRPRDRGF